VSFATREQEKAKYNLDYSLITAPFDGTIGISQVKLGDLVTPGQTLLNTISSDDPMGVDFVSDQSDLGRFRQLQTLNPGPGDSTFRLEMPGNTRYGSNGKISLIDRAVDPQSGTIRIRLVFPNPGHELRPGMNCTVKVLERPAGLQTLIPFKAVLEQMGEYFVFIDTNNVAKEVKVSLGPRVGGRVVIRNGLNPGNVVIVDGIGKLQDGSAIATGTQGHTAAAKGKYDSN
jgi:membrane fusion protein, multidrug efflux system